MRNIYYDKNDNIIYEHVFKSKRNPSRRIIIVNTFITHNTPKNFDYLYTCYAHPTRVKRYLENDISIFKL